MSEDKKDIQVQVVIPKGRMKKFRVVSSVWLLLILGGLWLYFFETSTVNTRAVGEIGSYLIRGPLETSLLSWKVPSGDNRLIIRLVDAEDEDAEDISVGDDEKLTAWAPTKSEVSREQRIHNQGRANLEWSTFSIQDGEISWPSNRDGEPTWTGNKLYPGLLVEGAVLEGELGLNHFSTRRPVLSGETLWITRQLNESGDIVVTISRETSYRTFVTERYTFAPPPELERYSNSMFFGEGSAGLGEWCNLVADGRSVVLASLSGVTEYGSSHRLRLEIAMIPRDDDEEDD